MLAKLYLITYNVLQTIGWGIVLYTTFDGLRRQKSPKEIYTDVQFAVNVAQTAALLEIVHAATRIVRTPVFTTLMQVWSRVMILWMVTYLVPSSRSSYGVVLYLLAWSITECIRYPFYALGQLNATPYVLTWLRYTLFIVLYPLGVCGELMTLYSSLEQVRTEGILTWLMPNKFNMSFDYATALVCFALLYIPFFPQLYFYMFAQRKKVLGGGDAKKRE